MEPRIQYAKTSDGVNIAFAEVGTGDPFVLMVCPGYGHAELNWTFYGAMRRTMGRAVWYDARGTGLSDRDAIDFSIEAMLRDFDAVVTRANLDSFVLAAWTQAVPIAVSYAAANPKRVSHLILLDGFSSSRDLGQTPAWRASQSLLETDWLLFTETLGQVMWAHSNPEFGRLFGEFMRACSEPDAHLALWRAWGTYEVTDLLPQIAAPTLVIHNKNNRLMPMAVGQRIAAAIPRARFAIIDDPTYAAVGEMVERFVEETQAAPEPAPGLPSGTAIILFADIADSTGLTERLGDTAFRGKARDLDTALRTVIREHSGTPIEGKLLGDGVLAVFTSARQAIEAALACARSGDDGGLPLHLGLHAGDVIREDNNVYGGAVNIASRITTLSAPGEVLVSDIVRGLARTSAGVRFEDRGEQALKGVGEAVRVWAVQEAE
jgi:class 3 adenylate cyclase/pimeloyl-ACP methyl ester carboxylesterase